MKKIIIIIAIILISNIILKAQNGKIEGRVYDAINNEPLPFVNVVIDGTTTGAVTDLDGNFIITGLEPGFVRLSVSFVGYKPALSDEIQVTNASAANVEIPLEQTDQKIEEVVVQVSPFKRTEESPVSLRSIGVSEIENNPGSNRDISRVIQSFPGVGSTPSFRNDVIIRGGGPNESRFYLDGVEIPNLNHFATQGASGGAVGIINADFIKSVDYYSGAFPANRSNALSGVFEFSQVDGNKERNRFRGTVGASELSLTLDGPIGERTTYIVSARQSYLQFLFNALELPFLPTFNDYQMKVRSRIDDKNEITVVSIGALDRFKLNTSLDSPTEEQQYILDYLPIQEQWNYTIGAVYKHFREKSYQTVVLSRNMLNNTSYKYPDNNEDAGKIYDYQSQEIENKLRIENTVRSNNFKITYGINTQYAKYNNDTYQELFSNGEFQVIDYESDFTLYKWGAFGQISRTFFNDRLSFSVGLRSDANNYSASMQNMLDQLSPRFSASYFLTEKWSVNFNTGRYFQLPPYTSMGYRDKDGTLVNKKNELKYIQSDHLIGGLSFMPNNKTKISVEGFYKLYGNYPFSIRDSIALANRGADFGVIGDEPITSTGEGRAYGAELLGRFKFDNNFFFILSYTYVRSEFKDAEDEYIPSSWDSKHLLTITSSKDFGKNWSIGFKWRFVGGLPYTPYDMETSAQRIAWDTQGRAFLDYERFNAERLKEFHQLDIRLDKSFYFNEWSLKLYLDIQNLYNYQAESADNILRVTDDNGNPIITNPTAPYEQQRYELKRLESTSGTILPTVGIMVEF